MSDFQPIKIKNEKDDSLNIDSELNNKNENMNININESSSDSDSDSNKKNKSSSKNSSSDDSESLSDSIDEERITLGQINKMARQRQKKKEQMDVKSFLQRKRHLDNNVITYDEKKGKILQEFCGTVEELNEFLNKCEIKKITFDDFSKINDIVSFDPNEWMKKNNIIQRTLSLEDMQIYYQEKDKKEKASKKKEKEKEKKIEKKEIPKNKEIKQSSYLKDKKILDDYINLNKIVECKKLSTEQKEWISNLISRIKKKDINDINIEKNSDGKYNKLEIVFDLDNTCIFSFLSNTDVLLVQKKKNIFPQKDVRLISFKFNNKVLYTALIIRKGLKEFLKYVSPLCNFHISTLGAENYGNEVKDILSEYANVDFIRYKGRVYSNEYCKNISDLYINSENAVIFDDYLRVWENENKDNEQVINSKFFFDEECAMLNNSNNNSKELNIENNDKVNEIELFIKSYRTMCYNKIKETSKNNVNFDYDWKVQNIIEYQNIPFYQFSSNKDSNDNKCFTAEYLTSSKFQFLYMKDVIKVIYCLKFIFDIDIRLAIKLIKICTLNKMKFDLKYLAYDQRCILTDMIKVCGGIIYDKNYNYSNNDEEKIYIVACKRIYEFKKEEIKEELKKNKNYVLINEKFILDTYYFMTDIRNNINDPEYIYDLN